jgi:E3 ubiquitin-protein ligase TRIP12
VVAKALQDQRLLDLPLSPVFYRLALGRKVDIFDLRSIDPAMGASLERLHAAQRAHAAGGGSGPVTIDGAAIEDLCLTFVLPGRPDYELTPGGADVAVTSANLAEYVEAVVDASLVSGVAAQVGAFQAAFEEIFPLSALKPFYVDEIEAMLCGTLQLQLECSW